MNHGTLLCGVMGLLVAGMVGCASSGRTGVSSSGEPLGSTYTDRDWAAVLAGHVHDGLVDYRSLADDRESLDRYCSLVSVMGPASEPEQFDTPEKVTAYWLNVYNALAIRIVLEHWPVVTVYDLSLPRFEDDYRFRVDGERRNLREIEAASFEACGGDCRVYLATSRAAMGGPRLPPEPFRAKKLTLQLGEAAARALDDTELLRIDHAHKRIYVYQVILRYQEQFEVFWGKRVGMPRSSLINVLLGLASPALREQLRQVTSYAIHPMPYNRRLNFGTTSGQGHQVP